MKCTYVVGGLVKVQQLILQTLVVWFIFIA